jgi:hypothetical protein
MADYFVDILFYDPGHYALWMRGVIEDFESRTVVSIEADSPEAALAWGEHVGKALLEYVHRGVVPAGPPAESSLLKPEEVAEFCRGGTPHVRSGEMPNLAELISDEYRRSLGLEDCPPSVTQP